MNPLQYYIAFLSLLTGAESMAQNAYDWTITDSAADWGVFSTTLPGTTTGGNYTRSRDLSGSWDQGNSGVFDDGKHGPYDGAAAVMHSYQTIGVFTRTDPNSIFDLSTTGSSAKMNFVYIPAMKSAASTGIGHLFEAGLTANSHHFGHASDDSIFVAAHMDTPNPNGLGAGTYDFELFNEDGIDQTPTNGSWSAAAITTLEANVDFDGVNRYGAGTLALVELEWFNQGAGQMKLDFSITNLNVHGTNQSFSVTGSSLAASGSNTFNHGLSDLSALRPGFGYRFNDSDLAITAANFDWESQYEAYKVPEPSSALMIILAGGILALRRRS